jgi:hypothetical protein
LNRTNHSLKGAPFYNALVCGEIPFGQYFHPDSAGGAGSQKTLRPASTSTERKIPDGRYITPTSVPLI